MVLVRLPVVAVPFAPCWFPVLLTRMVAQDLEDALGVITDDEDRRGADRRVILVQARRGGVWKSWCGRGLRARSAKLDQS